MPADNDLTNEKLATPAPWFADEGSFGDRRIADTPRISCIGEVAAHHIRPEDAACVAALRNAAPALIATIREQREELERMRVATQNLLDCKTCFTGGPSAEIWRRVAEVERALKPNPTQTRKERES
jgi:hypothetical protein